MKATVTNGHTNKIVGKFGKDSPTIQFLLSHSTIMYSLCSLESVYYTRFNARNKNIRHGFSAFVALNCG